MLTEHHQVLDSTFSTIKATLKYPQAQDQLKHIETSRLSFDEPALNAWLLSLSIIRKSGLRVKGIKSSGYRKPETPKTLLVLIRLTVYPISKKMTVYPANGKIYDAIMAIIFQKDTSLTEVIYIMQYVRNTPPLPLEPKSK